MTVYELTTPVTFYRPARWQPHLRYALLLPGRDITLSPARGYWRCLRKSGRMNVSTDWPVALSWPAGPGSTFFWT